MLIVPKITIRTRCLAGTIIGLVAAAISPCTVSGQPATVMELKGDPDHLELRVDGASTRQILDRLSQRFKLTYTLPAGVSTTLSGRYSGSLNRVLARVLDGSNYIVEVAEPGLNVIVFGATSAITRGAPDNTTIPGEAMSPSASATVGEASQQRPAPPSPPLPPQVPPLSNFLSDGARADAPPRTTP